LFSVGQDVCRERGRSGALPEEIAQCPCVAGVWFIYPLPTQFSRAALAITSMASGWRDRTLSETAPLSSQATAFLPDLETTLASFGEEIIRPYANA
jgi:hypothetical protein